jgi:hypothetical protein
LEHAGHSEESLQCYQRAVHSPKVDETSAVWFGNELHNRERHVDAVEAYLVAAQMDPNDATYYSHISDDLTWALLEEAKTLRREARQLPAGVSDATVVEILCAGFSCKVSPDDLRRFESAAKRIDIDLSAIMGRFRGESRPEEDGFSPPLERKERQALTRKLYEIFRSPLTDPTLSHNKHPDLSESGA